MPHWRITSASSASARTDTAALSAAFNVLKGPTRTRVREPRLVFTACTFTGKSALRSLATVSRVVLPLEKMPTFTK